MFVNLNSYIQPVGPRITFPTNISNIIAQINGSVDSNCGYVITGH